MTCDAGVGSPLPATLTCSRPYAPESGVPGGPFLPTSRGIDPGESLTVTYTQVLADAPGALTNTATVTDRITGDDNDSAQASVTVAAAPTAVNDSDLDNTIGDTVTVPVLGNDTGDLDPATVRILEPGTGNPLTTYSVPGQGAWSVNAVSGAISFTPAAGFFGDPAPISYRVADTLGQTASATVTVTYVPAAVDDTDSGNALGDPVTVPVLANDIGDFDPASVRIVTTGGDRVTTVTVPGQGVWAVNPATGALTFTPESGFEGDPTPVDYEVTDTTGDTVGATVTVTYVPAAVDDTDSGNTIGDPVTVPVLANDVGDFDPSTVRIIDPDTGDYVTELVVDGEGTWAVDTTTGAITFTPEDGFTGDPTVMAYRVTDSTGDTVSADVTVTYVPEATSDTSTGNTVGDPVTVDVLGNDTGVFDPSTVRILTPGTDVPVTELAIPGEGTWTVDPDTGAITFTPEDGFTGDPTPITYQVADLSGDVTTAQVSVDYVQSPSPSPSPSPPVPSSPPPANGPGGLAWTGAGVAAPLGGGAALMIAGAVLLLLARRRWAEQR